MIRVYGVIFVLALHLVSLPSGAAAGESQRPPLDADCRQPESGPQQQDRQNDGAPAAKKKRRARRRDENPQSLTGIRGEDPMFGELTVTGADYAVIMRRRDKHPMTEEELA